MSESARPFDHDPETATTRTFHGHSDGSFTIETQQDVTDLVAENRELYNETPASAPWGDGMERVASIPLNIFFELQRQGITDDPKAFLAWLNHPDNRVFRTRGGRL